MILVDTSAWISFLQADGSPADTALTRLLEENARLFTTDTVMAELLAGARDDHAAGQLTRILGSLERCAPMNPLDLEAGARLHRSSRDSDGYFVPLPICLVATVAMRDGLEVLTSTPDFERLARRAAPDLRVFGREPAGRTSRAQNADSPAAPPPAAPPQAAALLLVEDEAEAAVLIETALRHPGRTLVIAGSGHAARQRIAERPPDLIILDLVLPDGDGRNLLADFRRDPRTRDTPVVVVAGRVSPRTREECFALGADYVIAKPFDRDELALAVQHALVAEHAHRVEGDPLSETLTLSEMERLRTSGSPGNEVADWTVALIEVDGSLDGASVDIAAPDQADDPEALLPERLRAVMRKLVEETLDGEAIARWGVDQLVIGSPVRGVAELENLVRRLEALPDLGSHLSGSVRRVQQTEDLLDAVSRVVTGLVEVVPRPVSPRGDVESSTHRARPRAVLVEDDPVSAGLVRHRLERSGFLVHHEEDGARGLETILASPPSVVILDVQLPSMDGFEILGRMRDDETTRDVPVLMFTSLGREEHVQRGFDLGANDYVTKPFSPSELLTRVLRLVRRR